MQIISESDPDSIGLHEAHNTVPTVAAATSQERATAVSCVICCHNSATRIAEALEHLAVQNSDPNIDWEVIVIDNASTDGTAKVAQTRCPEGLRAKLRIVREERLGLTNARLRGLRESRFPIVSFIDDDVWVNEDWIERVSRLMSENPRIGALGGFGRPHFQEPPPAWFEKRQHIFTVGPQGESFGDMTKDKRLLWGSGLNIRKSVWEQLVRGGFTQLLEDRVGRRQTCGGDTELCFAVQMAGWQIWYDPDLTYQHSLPPRRLTHAYLREWFKGYGAASIILDAYAYVRDSDDRAILERVQQKYRWKVCSAALKTLAHLLASFVTRSDPSEDLPLEYLQGRLEALIEFGPQYDDVIKSIRQASWRHATDEGA